MENKSWDFGTAQAKVKVENGQLTWSALGNGGSSYPLRSVTGLQFEKGSFLSVMGAFVILVAGGDNRRVPVPNTAKASQIIEQINAYITASQEQERAKVAPAATAPQAFSVADELSKIAGLKQQGILTEQEFQELKQRLLNR